MQRLDIDMKINEILDTDLKQSMRLVLKYCPFDISERGVKYGINFYLANIIFHEDIENIPFTNITQDIERYFALLNDSSTIELLLNNLKNPKIPQIISQTTHNEHYNVLSRLIKKPQSVI